MTSQPVILDSADFTVDGHCSLGGRAAVLSAVPRAVNVAEPSNPGGPPIEDELGLPIQDQDGSNFLDNITT